MLCVLYASPAVKAHPAQTALSAAQSALTTSIGLLRPPKNLTNPQATNEAKSLLSFLVDSYGHKVLSGQQSLEDIFYVEAISGKQPAVGVFDLINYSPSRIEHGANPTGQTESWIDWAQIGGGIVSLSWHWNAPTDLIESEEYPWWRGFYTNGTTFDIQAALADPNSWRYQLLIRDLDAIALELAKFQQDGIPVLWRPLHEASGGWFWWGAKGPGPFIELWHLMYDRYVNIHGLHHLIWVYTVGDPAWYPGDDYVDIAGMDIYPDGPTSMVAFWQDTQNRHEGTKLVALTESGILPDPDKIRVDDVWWIWFSVWSGHFIWETDPNYLSDVYHDPDIITLDELIDWKNYPHDTSPPSGSITWPWNRIKIPEYADLTIRADADDADGTITKVEFFNGTTKLGEDTVPPYTCTWNQIPPGPCSLKAKATDSTGLVTTSEKISLFVGSEALPGPVRFEAEDAVSDGPSFSTNYIGYSGAGSMRFDAVSGTGVTFTVFANQPGNYPMIIRYLIPLGSGDKKNHVLVNGQLVWTPNFLNTGGYWADFDFGEITLNAGSNTVRIEHFWGWMFLDYIELTLPCLNPYPDGDFNKDTQVDIDDLAALSAGWTNPYSIEQLVDLAADWIQ